MYQFILNMVNPPKSLASSISNAVLLLLLLLCSVCESAQSHSLLTKLT